MRRRLGLGCVAAALLALSLARHGHGAPAASTSAAAPLVTATPLGAASPVVTEPPVSCAAVPVAGQAWPVASLRSLPVVQGSVISSVVRAQGTLEVQFAVPTSFSAAAGALTDDLTTAGFALVGGDRESKEQDVGFLNSALTGRAKFISIGPCESRGILSVVDPDAG